MPDDRRDQALSPEVRDQALAWLALSCSGNFTEQQMLEFQQWLQLDSEHARAWRRMQVLSTAFKDHEPALVDPIARSMVQRPEPLLSKRRTLLKVVLGTAVSCAGAWYGKDTRLVQGSLADLSTEIGQRRHHVLHDGTQLWLNTATAVDVDYGRDERRLTLRYGEVGVLTGNDLAGRPLVVVTRDAQFAPQGTHFTVHADEARAITSLAVTQGAVAVTASGTGAMALVQAGQQVAVDHGRVSLPAALEARSTAWINGLIIVERMRLGDFTRELTRYLPGIVRCDPHVAALELTGSFPLDDLTKTFAMLERSLPVKVNQRTRYWTSITGV